MKNVMIAAWITDDDKYESYPEALKKNGADSFISLNPADFSKADALILPGSFQDMNPKLWGEENTHCHDVNDELDRIQWQLMEMAVKDRKPVLGVCRGMQFINVFFGGTLIQHLPSSEHHGAQKPEKYHDLATVKGTALGNLFPERTTVNTRHHQGVGVIGNGLKVSALWSFGDDTVVEAIEHQELPIIGLQWHPERMCLADDPLIQKSGDDFLKWWLDL